MPISNDEARHYAERFNNDEQFNRALRGARQTMNHRRLENISFAVLPPIQAAIDEALPLPTLQDTEQFSFSRADMEQIDRALTGTLREREPRISFADMTATNRDHTATMHIDWASGRDYTTLGGRAEARHYAILNRIHQIQEGPAAQRVRHRHDDMMDGLMRYGGWTTTFDPTHHTLTGTRPEPSIFDDIVPEEERPIVEALADLTQPSRETPTMTRAIPHPLADFDERTEFLFYNPFSTDQAILGYANERALNIDTHNLWSQLQDSGTLVTEPVSRADQCRYLPECNYNVYPGQDVLALCSNIHTYAGLPVQRIEPVLLHADSHKDPKHIITPSTNSALCYWDNDGKLAKLHYPLNSARTDAHGWKAILQIADDAGIHSYMTPSTVALPPITSLTEAWDRCSEAWRHWAIEHSGRDPDVLLWETLQLYPTVFGLNYPSEFDALWGTPEVIDATTGHLLRINRTLLKLTAPTYNTDDKTLELFRQPKDLITGRRTKMRVGKALKAVFGHLDDENIKALSSSIIGTLTPPEFHIGFTKADFDEAYTNGPSSCMTYQADRYYLLQGVPESMPEARPTDAMVNGDIGIAVMRAAGKVTARAIIVESKKCWVRIYAADYATAVNGKEALKDALESAGYTEEMAGLVGQTLVKIPVPVDSLGSDAQCAFNATPRGVIRGTTTLNSLTEAQQATAIEKLDMRAYLAPYIDWNNPTLVETDDGLLVTDRYDDWGSSVPSNLDTARRGARPPGDRLGRVYYEAGGLVTANYAETLAWINECREQNAAAATDTAAAAPPAPEPANTPPSQPAPRATWSQRLRNTCTDIVSERDDDNYDPDDDHWPVYDSWSGNTTSYELTDYEVVMLSDNLGSNLFETCETPDGELVWIEQDEISVDAGDNAFINCRASDYNLVYCETDGEWHNLDDCVLLNNGDQCHIYAAIEVDGEWYHEDDEDIVWCDRDDCHYLEEHCCYLGDGEYALRDECYRLPNGDYIHEADLESAA